MGKPTPGAVLPLSFAAGTMLFRDGDEGDVMYVLRSGRIRIFTEVGERTKQLAILGPGDFFGELALLNGKPRTASAEAIEDVEVLEIDPSTLRSMVASNAEIAVRLIQRMAERLDSANTLIDLLMHQDPKARVILGISHEAEFNGQVRDDGSVLVRSGRAQLAEQVALPEAEVAEVIQRLARLGIVEEVDGGLVVPDRMRLHDFLAFIQKSK